MIRMFKRHEVRDYDAWKRVYDASELERREFGVRDGAVFRGVEDRNDVTVWHDFDDLQTARAYVGSERLSETMEKGGVVGEPQIWFVDRELQG